TDKMRAAPLMEMKFFLDGDDASDVCLHDLQGEDGSEGDAQEEFPAPPHSRSSIRQRVTDTRDALQSYLQDIGGLDLLTPGEEIDLARRAAAGDGLARRKLIESNLRLVIALA